MERNNKTKLIVGDEEELYGATEKKKVFLFVFFSINVITNTNATHIIRERSEKSTKKVDFGSKRVIS